MTTLVTIPDYENFIKEEELLLSKEEKAKAENLRLRSAALDGRDAAKIKRAAWARAKAAGDSLPDASPSLEEIDAFDLEYAWRTEADAEHDSKINLRNRRIAAGKSKLAALLHNVSAAMSVAELESDLMPAMESLEPLLNRMMALYYVSNFEYPDPKRRQPPLRNSAADSFGPVAHFIEHLRQHNWAIWPFCMRPNWLPKNPGRTSGYEPLPGTWAAVEQLKQELAQ